MCVAVNRFARRVQVRYQGNLQYNEGPLPRLNSLCGKAKQPSTRRESVGSALRLVPIILYSLIEPTKSHAVFPKMYGIDLVVQDKAMSLRFGILARFSGRLAAGLAVVCRLCVTAVSHVSHPCATAPVSNVLRDLIQGIRDVESRELGFSAITYRAYAWGQWCKREDQEYHCNLTQARPPPCHDEMPKNSKSALHCTT